MRWRRGYWWRVYWLGAVLACVGLGWLGSKPPEGIYPTLSLIGTIWYFAHFLIILPVLGWVEKTKPVPPSIADAVLAEKH